MHASLSQFHGKVGYHQSWEASKFGRGWKNKTKKPTVLSKDESYFLSVIITELSLQSFFEGVGINYFFVDLNVCGWVAWAGTIDAPIRLQWERVGWAVGDGVERGSHGCTGSTGRSRCAQKHSERVACKYSLHLRYCRQSFETSHLDPLSCSSCRAPLQIPPLPPPLPLC